MKIKTLFSTWGRLQREKAGTLPMENNMIRVPFAFQIGDQYLPEGQYRVEMLTESKPGTDEVEIVAFREVHTHLYVSFLAFLERGESEKLRLTFRHDGERSQLTEIQVGGKCFRLAPSRFAKEAVENEGLYQTITGEEGDIWEVAR
jgi:hypothetical protein